MKRNGKTHLRLREHRIEKKRKRERNTLEPNTILSMVPCVYGSLPQFYLNTKAIVTNTDLNLSIATVELRI